MNLVAKAQAAIRKYQMLKRGDKVLVALSGGPDSVALFHVLLELKKEFSLNLAAAHYNHRLRGKDSDRDESFARTLADKYKVEFIPGRAAPGWHKKLKGSTEDLAREMRYAFLLRAAAKTRTDKVGLGHNADDQAESVLINLLRGSGMLGLASMPPVRDKFIRPLLQVTHEQILEYCDEKGFAFRTDKTNLDKRFLRNRIRAELIPMLKTYNPAIVAALGKTSELLREDEKFLEKTAAKAFAKLAHCRLGRISFHLPKFFKEDLAIRRRLIRLAILALKKDLRRISATHVLELEQLLDAGKPSFEIDLPAGITILKSYDRLSIELAQPKPAIPFKPVRVKIPGETSLRLSNEYQLSLKIEPSDYARFKKSSHQKPKRGSIFETGIDQVYLCLNHPQDSLWLRTPRPGDRLQPLGMNGHRKLKEILQDLQVPRNLRPIYPVLASQKETLRVLWVPSYGLSENFKVLPESSQICLLKIRLQSRSR